MKRKMVKGFAVTLVICGLTLGGSNVFAADNAPKKEKGPALQQLEGAAGKKIEDVKVPDVPKPKPVNTNQGGKKK
ncbi:MAG: hypothetical protein ABFD12_01800 [Syntrophorhabdus sp.]